MSVENKALKDLQVNNIVNNIEQIRKSNLNII